MVSILMTLTIVLRTPTSADLEVLCRTSTVSFAWSFISPLALVHPFPLRGPSPQGETRRDGTPLLLLKHAKYSAELATFGGSPLSGFAGLSPRESVSHDSQVALLPYESCSLATPSGDRINRSMLSCRDMAPWLSIHSAPVEVPHRTSKWGEVRRLACPLRRFPFATL